MKSNYEETMSVMRSVRGWWHSIRLLDRIFGREIMKKFVASIALATFAAAAVPQTVRAQGTPQTITAVDVKEVATGLRASKIIGSDVVNLNKDTIGKIDDLIISTDHKLIAVISVGGFLGIGTKLVAVRYDDLQPTSNNTGFILPGATKDSLKALPEFSYR
jgi:PRC-barrel domain